MNRSISTFGKIAAFYAGLSLSNLAHATLTAQQITSIQAVELKNALPGNKIPYYLRNDEGIHYLIGGMNLNVLARSQDTDNMYEMMTWTGGKGLGSPLHQFTDSHQALYVMDGQVELWLGDKHYLLTRGDYASIPAHTTFAFNFRSHRTKLFNWATGPGTVISLRALGIATDSFLQPETGNSTISSQAFRTSEKLGFVQWGGRPPAGVAEPV